MNSFLPRRTVLGAGVAAAAGAALGGRAFAQAAKPKSPLALTIVDVAGNLALTQKAFENYRAAKPDMVSRLTFTKAPARSCRRRSWPSKTPSGSTSTWC